jgi:O-methyltransferase
MNPRREGLFQRALVNLAIDPLLKSKVARSRLKQGVKGESPLLRFALRHAIDPTTLPPPNYTRARADEVYGSAFRRCVEFVSATGVQGDVLEFGTLLGYTARWLAALMVSHGHEGTLWLYDSFEGLPEPDHEVDSGSYEVLSKVWRKESMKVDPEIAQRIERSLSRVLPPNRLRVVKGFFDQTLPTQRTTRAASIVHVDCDLYSSAHFVLDTLLSAGLYQDGTVIILDDYNCNRASPSMGERRALQDVFSKQDQFTLDPWFSYGWHGQVYFVHARSKTDQTPRTSPPAEISADAV